jgi:hypothetical protein
MKILKYRRLAQLTSDELTRQRIADLIADLEKQLREIDE